MSRGENISRILIHVPYLPTGDHMETMTATQVNDHVRDLLDTVTAGQSVTITRNGKVVAVVLPASFLQLDGMKPVSA